MVLIMIVRRVDGYVIGAIAIQDSASQMFWPALDARKEGGDEVMTYRMRTPGGIGMSKDDALRSARGFLARVVVVTEEGLLLDR
jgi:hypothetical protein